MTNEERFWAKVEKDQSGCWLWTGAKNSWGYGYFWLDGRNQRAHIVAWEMKFGPVPLGMHLDHDCHNKSRSCVGGKTCKHRACVNPDHLVTASPKQNVLSGKGRAAVNARKTHCHKGHPLSGRNLGRKPDGARRCKRCSADATSRYSARQKQDS